MGIAHTYKSGVKSVLGRSLVSTGAHRRLLGQTGIVVAFHRVNDSIPVDSLTVGSRTFERFCRFFRSYFDVISLADFVGRLQSGRPVSSALAITFDDGYLDNFEVAAPILRQLGLPATFFIATRFIETDVVPWWDTELPRQPGWMTWDQVKTLSREGFDIGAHTQTHVDLGQVTESVAADEVAGSREDVRAALGRYPEHFAYPYGRRDNITDANREIVKSAGFSCCVSCHGGLAPTGADPFRLQRVPISNWFLTPDQFAFEVSTSKE